MDTQLPSERSQQVPAPLSESRLPSTEVYQSVPDFDDTADIRDYLDVVLRRKWLILTILLCIFITTLVVSLQMQPVYMAKGRLELSPRSPQVTKFEDLAAGEYRARETEQFIQTQVKLLLSGTLARRVVEQLRLEQHPLFNPDAKESEHGLLRGAVRAAMSTIKSWLKQPASQAGHDQSAGPDIDKLFRQKHMEDWFLRSLQAQPERNTSLVSLSFSSTDPALARDAVNTLIHEFVSWEMDKRIDSAKSAKQQLEKQIEIARIQLEKAESNLNQFAQKAGIVSLSSNLNLIYRQLEEVNNALAMVQSERIAKEALYNRALKGDVSSLPLAIDNQLLQRLREQHTAAMAEYEQTFSIFKEDYPRLKNLRARMENIHQKIKNEEARLFDSIKNDYTMAVEREESLKKEAEEKKRLALDLNNRSTQYKILEREVETNKQIYQSLLERAKEIEANVGTDLSNIRVVDYADLPLMPYKPNVLRNLLLALVVGLMGGVGLAFLLEYLDNTVKRLDEISDRFQLPVLGVVPSVSDDEEIRNLDHLVRLKPKSGFSEAIRTTKVSIQLSSYMEHPPKLMLITSTAAGEGKSTIAANLAQAFASTDENVVVLDADLRKPRLSKIFNTNGNRGGLSQVLSGMCKLEEVIQKTDVPNLYFIQSGPIPPNPAELLASRRMKQLLEKLSKHFDRIILDSPPATGFADVLALSNYVHAVILITTLGQTHREALRILRKSLYNVGGNLLGTIVNRLDLTSHYGGYYYKYYKYYQYYYHPYGQKPGEKIEKLPEAG